jgi:hypothetical protein
MKKVLLLLIAFVFTATVYGQSDTSYWKSEGLIGFKFSQTGYKNWSSGGENAISGIGSFKYKASYTKDKISWDNLLLADLGFMKQGKGDAKKTDDRIDFNTMFGYKASKHWFYSALLNFRTQSLEGYNYEPDTPVYISNFMAPAYIKLALGMDFKPNDHFTLFLSPATARWTIVQDQTLADYGAFGLTPAVFDTNGNVVTHASKVRMEVGAYLRFGYSVDLMENIRFMTKLELYSNYLKNPQNIDVDWEVDINFKINEFFNASINTHLIYDDDVLIGVDKDSDGTIDYYGPRTQFKEVLGLGISYKF